jgi:peroxiredoxin
VNNRFVFSLIILLFLLVGTVPSIAQGSRRSGSRGADLESELPQGVHELKIGDPAPDFSLRGIDGRTYSLADFKDSKILMVIFLSNHCPYSHAAETRLLPFLARVKGRGLGVVAINPNHPDAVRLDELGYSKYTDSFDDMKIYAREQGFTFPYLYDGETQKTAMAYGCLATPHVFVFDEKRRLRYMGRFDDSRFADPATVTSSDAPNAIEALLSGKPVPVEVTRPQGCSTKWLSNKVEIQQVEEQWKNAPVAVETVDSAGIAALARNPTQKLRLINVWATWCAPCTQEFPGFVSMSRRLGNRDFELITISIDDPKDQAAVQKFLEKQHVAIPNRVRRSLKKEGRTANNYLFSGANTDIFARVLDPAWKGPVPFTVLIAPGGKILYHQVGEINVAELQNRVIDQLGPYY